MELAAERYKPAPKSASFGRQHHYFTQHVPNELDYPFLKTFRASLDEVDVVANRKRIILRELQGKRVLLRMRVDLYGSVGGRNGYVSMRRTAIVLSAKDAKQAEAALVTLIRLTEKLNGMELDADDLRMEYL
jgi:hypothetical protein